MESAFTPNFNTIITGIDELMKGLRFIHVNFAKLSATLFKKVYKQTNLHDHLPNKIVYRFVTELQN